MSANLPLKQATFTRFDHSRAEDWLVIDAHFQTYQNGVAERVLSHLLHLRGDQHGYPVDRYTHSLQTATRALRADADEETVVCALLHDIGDDLAPANHAEIAAAILEPYIDPLNAWMIRHHELFQGYHYRHFYGLDPRAREHYRDHPGYARTVRFCDDWDQRSFDPQYDTLPLEHFRPMVARLFARQPLDAMPSIASAGAATTRESCS